MKVHQRRPLKIINSVNDSFLFPPYEHLWGDPGPPGKNAQRANYTFFHPKHNLSVCVTHSSSILPHEHLWRGL